MCLYFSRVCLLVDFNAKFYSLASSGLSGFYHNLYCVVRLLPSPGLDMLLHFKKLQCSSSWELFDILFLLYTVKPLDISWFHALFYIGFHYVTCPIYNGDKQVVRTSNISYYLNILKTAANITINSHKQIREHSKFKKQPGNSSYRHIETAW